VSIVYISSGSNLGDKKANILKAIDKIKSSNIEVLCLSSFYKTKPYGYQDQDDFYNIVMKIKTNHSPQNLLKLCLEIEKDMGRTRTIKWGPRTIDLDLLFFDKKIINTKELVIPHPDLHNRDFVLKPLLEISPQLVHPVFKKTIQDFLKNLPSSPFCIKLSNNFRTTV